MPPTDELPPDMPNSNSTAFVRVLFLVSLVSSTGIGLVNGCTNARVGNQRHQELMGAIERNTARIEALEKANAARNSPERPNTPERR